MAISEKLNRIGRIIRVVYLRKFIHVARKIKLPGFQGVSLWEIIFFFLYSLRKGLIGMRAGAVAFHFFLAIIPFGLVLVVLTSYTPGISIESDIAPVVSALIPDQLVAELMKGMDEYENSSVSSLISFGFVFALYFASNGFNVLIKAFNSSKIEFAKREKWWSIRLVSFGFVVVFLVALIAVFYMLILVRKGFNIWADSSNLINDYFTEIYITTDIIFLGLFVYSMVAFIYYFGPRKKKGFTFFSPGASLAFFLIVVISIFYQLYISNFANYNALYGSLGTFIMVMLYVYMISFALLIGFELNASIHGAIQQKKLNNLDALEKRYDKTT
ncbi:YihY/virulence factor BrkB family protein [Paracrocinitomix mangrovi]|uniref:YihY/virulence factor BrkB family protein n=1 Tax=Paracrocinitomix mangrovi TaxID=2862509 RepID=UPI001C8ED77D|nr:YihY/virulence factor BrkB family protein [Paracrocinitomix mangrovi]UKN00138.1 YihY/virulence factor BrkB family protein [Paracrocinitomix mangrovi]